MFRGRDTVADEFFQMGDEQTGLGQEDGRNRNLIGPAMHFIVDAHLTACFQPAADMTVSRH